jgi:hypothetical protein
MGLDLCWNAGFLLSLLLNLFLFFPNLFFRRYIIGYLLILNT